MDVVSETKPHRPAISNESQRVLVVDDNNLNRDLLRIRLEREQCEVLEAENGELALAMLAEHSVDLIILDVVMPVMDGMETLKALKANEAYKHIPVIMVSAVGETETVAQCLTEGADDFLTKPFNPAFLKVRMRACFEQKRLHDLEAQQQSAQTNPAAEEVVVPVVQEGAAGSTAEALVMMLAKLIESRGVDKGSRLDRIREYSRVMAEHLRTQAEFADIIDDAFLQALNFAAPLHDIGKISISDAIINKPGRLDDHERAVMQQHTQVGAEALRALQETCPGCVGLQMAADIALCHHERWDGNGYPRKLSGDAIPLAARILTLGDVYDALTSRRTHRDASGHEEAKAILLEERDKQFDPAIVDAFMATENEFMMIRVRYLDPRKAREE